MEVSRLSFSAHADDQGIKALMRHFNPRKVMFVHGDQQRMFQLALDVSKELDVECLCPANFEETLIGTDKE